MSIATPARSSRPSPRPSRTGWLPKANVEIGAKTRLLVVIGDPVAHSLSPAMHNAAFRALGLDAVYVALHVNGEALAQVLAMQIATQGAGNVTVDRKSVV